MRDTCSLCLCIKLLSCVLFNEDGGRSLSLSCLGNIWDNPAFIRNDADLDARRGDVFLGQVTWTVDDVEFSLLGTFSDLFLLSI